MKQVYVVTIESRQTGVAVEVYATVFGALERGRGLMKARLDKLGLPRPTYLSAAGNFFSTPRPYSAAIEDDLHVTVERKEIIG